MNCPVCGLEMLKVMGKYWLCDNCEDFYKLKKMDKKQVVKEIKKDVK